MNSTVYVNGRKLDIPQTALSTIVQSFCLFDTSYEKYDRVGVGDLTAMNLLTAAYHIQGRSPTNKETLLAKLDQILTTQLCDTVKKLKSTKLQSATDGEVSAAVELLVRFSTIRGVSVALASKMLHRFLPDMIPIIDNKCIRICYGNHEIRADEQSVRDIMHRIRADLSRSKQCLLAIRNTIERNGIELSTLRVFDILLWFVYRKKVLFDVPL